MSSKPKRIPKRGTFGRVPGSRKPKQNSDRLQLKVGEQWPDGLVAKTEPVKAGVIAAIVGLCLALITAITIYSMALGNSQRLDKVLDMSWTVLGGFGVWATAAHWKRAKAIVRTAINTLRVLRE